MLAVLIVALLAQAQPAAAPPVGGALAQRIAAAERAGPLAPEAQQRLQTFRDAVAAVRARHCRSVR